MRTIAAVAFAGVIAFVVLRVVGGVLGGVLGLLLGLAFLALKLLIVAGVIYFVLSIVSPDTAKKVRERVSL